MSRIPENCADCNKILSLENTGTYIAKHGPRAGQRVLRGRCNECIARYKRARYAANPAKYIAESMADYRKRLAANPDLCWERSLYRFHRMRRAEYESILADQNGVCAACHQPPTEGKRLEVDHCHRTGKRRGLLCGSCNRALGQADDSIERLHMLIKYLETRSAPPGRPAARTR